MIGKAEVLKEYDVRNVLNMIKSMDNPQRNRIIFLLSYLVGMRVCNIQKLQISDVFDDNGKVFDKIVLSKDKNKFHKIAEYYLNDEMKKELINYYKFLKNDKMKLCENDYLIQSNKTGKYLRKESIVRIFRQIYDKCGLAKCRSHSGRRTFITDLCDKGVAIQVVSKLVNHKSISTTMGYYQQNPTTLLNAVNAMSL